MNRGFVIAGALAAAAAVAIVSVRACAAVPAAESYAWESGVNYQVLGRPQTTPYQGQDRSRRSLLVRLWPLLCARPDARELEAEETRVHRVRAHPGDLGPDPHAARPALLHDAGTASRRPARKSSTPSTRKGTCSPPRPTSRRAPASRLLPEIRYHRSEIQCRLRFSRSQQNLMRAESLTGRYEVASVPRSS